jgi:hypothetical protein
MPSAAACSESSRVRTTRLCLRLHSPRLDAVHALDWSLNNAPHRRYRLLSQESRPSSNSEIVRPSDYATDIGLGEVIALEEEWLARRAGQRVAENIAKIETGGVMSLAEASVALLASADAPRRPGTAATSALWISESSSRPPASAPLPSPSGSCSVSFSGMHSTSHRPRAIRKPNSSSARHAVRRQPVDAMAATNAANPLS